MSVHTFFHLSHKFFHIKKPLLLLLLLLCLKPLPPFPSRYHLHSAAQLFITRSLPEHKRHILVWRIAHGTVYNAERMKLSMSKSLR